MDPSDPHAEPDSEVDSPPTPRKLPDDLPKSLDDRRSFPSYAGETEMYDGWQGRNTTLLYTAIRN